MDRFTTLDLYLAAYLSLNGCQPALESRGSKILFTFHQNQNINRFIEQFNANSLIAVADFTLAVKTLRGRMIQARRSSS
jgi:hypothetical protein